MQITRVNDLNLLSQLRRVVSLSMFCALTFAGCGGGGGGGENKDPINAGSPPTPVGCTGTGLAPKVLYTDALSGPITGGEFGQGAYLSIFGKNFGAQSGMGKITKVYIGGAEVANYRYLGDSKVAGKLGIQQITVQVGNLNNPALGKPLPVVVEVNCVDSNGDHTFTPNPGRILFVSKDSKEFHPDTKQVEKPEAGNINRPWRYLQTPSNGGVGGILRAGDHIVIRGGDWSDTGHTTAWLRFRYPEQQGSAPTGKGSTGWIHITAYPGPVNGNTIEDVHYYTPAGAKGGIHGAEGDYFQTTGDWVSISNLRMEVDPLATSDAAPINLQYSAGPWRVVNNELGPWLSTTAPDDNAKGAGVSGHGKNVKVLGNHIFKMHCDADYKMDGKPVIDEYGLRVQREKENHGIYADSGATAWEIAYNYIHDIEGGNLIQLYDNLGLAGKSMNNMPANWTGFTEMKVHHNWLENSNKYGLNLSVSTKSAQIWNNVVIGARYAGLRIDTYPIEDMKLMVAFNTFYDNDRIESGSGNGQILNSRGSSNSTEKKVGVYNNIFAAGPNTYNKSKVSRYFYNDAGSSDNYFDFQRNLYWDNGLGWGGFARDTQAVFGSPGFANAGGGNFRLNVGSPALNLGNHDVMKVFNVADPLTVADDFTIIVTRPQGAANDLGAFERPQ